PSDQKVIVVVADAFERRHRSVLTARGREGRRVRGTARTSVARFLIAPRRPCGARTSLPSPLRNRDAARAARGEGTSGRSASRSLRIQLALARGAHQRRETLGLLCRGTAPGFGQ